MPTRLPIRLLDLGHRFGELVQIGVERAQEANEGAPASVTPSKLDIGHVCLAGARPLRERLLSDTGATSQRAHSLPEGARVVSGDDGHGAGTCDIRCVAVGSIRPNIVPPRCANSRGRGTRSMNSRRARHPTETVTASPSLEAVSRSLQPQEEPTMITPAVEVPDSLVLAAIERAALHRADGETAVPAWAITEHLGIPRRSRHVRVQLAALEAAGAIERSRRHGIAVLSLTSAGKRRLARARRAGTIELPESPQHAKWRNTRTLAGQEIERCHRAARDAVKAATEMLDAPVSAGPGSDGWFEMAERLRRACWRLGSATYCLREWPEPSDARADVDERLEPHERTLDVVERTRLRARRQGRRGFTGWREA